MILSVRFLRGIPVYKGHLKSNFQQIILIVKAHFPENSVNNWQPATYEGHAALDLHRRYFTSQKLAPNKVNLPFMEVVDSDGVLASVRGQDLIHGPDNQVHYLELVVSDKAEDESGR